MKKIVFILLIGLLTCNVSAQKKTAVKQRPTQEQKAKPSKKRQKQKQRPLKTLLFIPTPLSEDCKDNALSSRKR